MRGPAASTSVPCGPGCTRWRPGSPPIWVRPSSCGTTFRSAVPVACVNRSRPGVRIGSPSAHDPYRPAWLEPAAFWPTVLWDRSCSGPYRSSVSRRGMLTIGLPGPSAGGFARGWLGLGPEALQARCRLDRRAVHREVFVAQQPRSGRLTHDRVEELQCEERQPEGATLSGGNIEAEPPHVRRSPSRRWRKRSPATRRGLHIGFVHHAHERAPPSAAARAGADRSCHRAPVAPAARVDRAHARVPGSLVACRTDVLLQCDLHQLRDAPKSSAPPIPTGTTRPGSNGTNSSS